MATLPRHVLTLKRTYGAMYPMPSSLPHSLVPDSDSDQFQKELVNEVLHSPHFCEFPPSREFRRQFWKWIVERLEGFNEEVDIRIYEAYLDLLSVNTPHFKSHPPSPSYSSHFWFPNSPSLTNGTENLKVTALLESRTMVEGGTTGLRTWGASLRLADWLISHSEVVQGRRVLELGSGAGFLGLIISTLQLEKYKTQQYHLNTPSLVLTDVNSEVLSRCRSNFQLPCNNLNEHPSLNFRILDWSDALDGEGDIDHHSAMINVLKDADVVIGADLVYDVTIVPALVAVLALFFSIDSEQEPTSWHDSRSAYIALTVRREDTVSKFLDCLSLHLLNHEEIDLSTGPEKQFMGAAEDEGVQNVKLVRISKKSSS